MEPIAIIGLAHRFPGGANDPSKLWALLNSGRDISRAPSADRLCLRKFYHPDATRHGSSPVLKSYFLDEDPRMFDAGFFHISPLEAVAMDPQQRLLLETVYEATETAGIGLEKFRGSRCSVFVGVMTGDYYDLQARDPDDLSPYTASGASRAILANRISYFFDLSGTSICLDTACSSSLVALNLAVQELRNGISDTAIVAGSNLIFGPEMYITESKLHMLSPTGKCKMWDASADGYARGEGVAALLLKPLSQALRDNDPVQAVIRNTGVNSDGRTPGITMPSAKAQARLIQETYRAAGLDPMNPTDRCQYFEAHGTGTKVGDPIEARGIFESFFTPECTRGSKLDRLVVGSVKTVLGHLEGCAGLAGIIKVVLAMKYDMIPPNLHLNRLNPEIECFQHALQIPKHPISWRVPVEGQPKRASVNSFGFGGTNAHAIIESYETNRNLSHQKEDNYSFGLIVLSADCEKSLTENIRQLAAYIRKNLDANLRDIAWTLWARHNALSFRKAFSETSREKLLAALEEAASNSPDTNGTPMGVRTSPLISPQEGFGILGIFTGQGAQWQGMGRALLTSSLVFKESIGLCDQSLSTLHDAPSWSLARELMANEATSRMSEAEISQPATTAIQIGLVNVLKTAGIQFSAVVGHSSGEIAASYAAGILTLSDAIRIAFYRGLHANLAGKGAMMAVSISADAAQELCQEDNFLHRIHVAAKNSPSSVTLSGDGDAIMEAEAVFKSKKIFARVLRTDKAYHSPHMKVCVDAYLQSLQACCIEPQQSRSCVWISSVDGSADRYWNQDLGTLCGSYWIENMIKPVLFTDAVTSALTNGGPFDVAIEVGPHPALKGPFGQIVRPHLGNPPPYLGCMNRNEDCGGSFSALVGLLWSSFGVHAVDLQKYERCWDEHVPIRRIVEDLPTYSWNHSTPFWRESRISRNHRLRDGGNEGMLLGHRCPDDSDWEPRWRNFLSLKEFPWLRGHAFRGEVLFPAAGYVVLILEAAQFLAGVRQVASVEICNLSFERALRLQNDTAPVEIISSLKVLSTKEAGESMLAAEFSLYAIFDPSTSAMERTCHGSVSIYFGEPCDGLFPSRVQCLDTTVTPVDIDRFYYSVRAVGLEYEGPFRGLKSMSRADGISTARASWSAQEVEYGSIYHPALLDTSLQPIFAAFAAPTTEKMWTAYLPQRFEKIIVNTQRQITSSITGTADITIDARIAEASATRITGDIEMYSVDDGCAHPVLQIEGITLAALSKPDASSDRIIFSEARWEADMLSGFQFPVAYNPPEEVLVEEAERVALFFCRRATSVAQQVGFDSLKPHEKRIVEHLRTSVDLLLRDKGHVWVNDSRQAIDAIISKRQDQVDFELMRIVGDEIESAFKREKTMTEVLSKDGKLDQFRQNGLGVRNTRRQVSSYMRAISHRYPKSNILELGAGTGLTTEAVLDAIGLDFGSYTFTDESDALFPAAQDKLADHAGRIYFQKLDVSQSFDEQGFRKKTYDVVISDNGLHMSLDPEAVLRQVRGLLRPGGFFIAVEPTSKLLRLQLIMSSLEGWRPAQDDCRRVGPVASIETWDKELRKAGFYGVDLWNRDQLDEKLHTYTSFVSQARDPIFDAIRKPLQHVHRLPGFDQVVIIGGSTLAISRAVRDLSEQLLSVGIGATQIPDIRSVQESNLPPSSFVLYLAELDQPTFGTGVDHSTLPGMQTLFKRCLALMVITRNASSANPFSNMLMGLCRGLRAEKPSLRLQILDLDNSSRLDCSAILQHFLRLVLIDPLEIESHDALWTSETELSARGGTVFVPRIKPSLELNDSINSTRRGIAKEVTTDTHILEIHYSMSSYEVIARPKIVRERLGLSVVDVDFSTVVPLQLLPGQALRYLCLGRIQDDYTRVVIAWSHVNSSVIQVPKEDMFFVSEVDAKAEMLWALAITMLAQAWVRAVPRGRAIWIHGAEESVVGIFKEEAKERGVSICTTSCDPANTSYLHPRAPVRAVRSTLPNNISALVLGESLDSAESKAFISRMESMFVCRDVISGRLSECPMTWHDGMDLSHYLTTAYAKLSKQTDPSTISNELSVHTIGELCSSSTGGPTCVVDWRDTSNSAIRTNIQPVDASQLFGADKTYFLVGLTGDLGLSICSWMIKNGARHIVLASRHPNVSKRWLDSMSNMGATVLVVEMDVTDVKSVQAAVNHISERMPTVAGICNGSMVLADRLFGEMNVESMESVIGPKVRGSINLDGIFSGYNLEFFIMFSSIASVIGTPGQSNYHMANMFMAGLAADRKRRGLAGSVIDISMVSDVGYVTRQNVTVERNLRNMHVLPLCEEEIHTMFVEGILAGMPAGTWRGQHCELITGLAISENEASRPHWAKEPRFSFYIRDESKVTAGKLGSSLSAQVLLESETEAEIVERIRQALLERLVSLLQLESTAVNMDSPLVSLGLDSLLAMEIQSWFRKATGAEVSALQILGGVSGESLCKTAASSVLLHRQSTTRVKDSPGSNTTSSTVENRHNVSPDGLRNGGDTTLGSQKSSKIPTHSQSNPSTTDSAPRRRAENGNKAEHMQPQRSAERKALMSFAQAQLWFLQGFLEDPCTYNETAMYEIHGSLDVGRLQRAFIHVSLHHEILRTCYYTDSSTDLPMQAVLSSSALPFRYVEQKSTETAAEEFKAMKARRWDLEGGISLGITIVRKSDDFYTFILGSHHIAIDRVTWIIILRDIARVYAGEDLSPTSQYIEFAVKQRQMVEAGDFGKEIEFWKTELSELPETIPLFPMSHTRTRKATNHYSFVTSEIELDLDVCSHIKRTSRELQITPFHFHFSVLLGLISGLSKTSDICVGMVESGRPNAGAAFADTAGFFVNIVPVRVRVEANDDIEGLCNKLSSTVLTALQNSAVPLDVLLNKLRVNRTRRHSPLFQVVINYRPNYLGLTSIGGSTLKYMQSRSASNPFDMCLNISETPDGTCFLHLDVQEGLYSKEAARSILDSYSSLLTLSYHNPRRLAADLTSCELLGRAQTDLNGIGRRVKSDWAETIPLQVERVANSHADAVAVRDDSTSYTYADFMMLINRVAAAVDTVRDHTRTEHFCCLLFDPSADYVASLLAVMKVGGVAIPLDSMNNKDRLATIVADCKPAAILHHAQTCDLASWLARSHPTVTTLDISQLPAQFATTENKSNPAATATVFYTSGTTGAPKGAVLTQSNYSSIIASLSRAIGFRFGEEAMLQHTSLGFDLSIMQIFLALATGNTLVMASKEQRGDPCVIAELALKFDVTCIASTPTELKYILQEASTILRACKELRRILVGGEPFTVQLAAQIRENMSGRLDVYNMYGPSETCILSSTGIVEYWKDDIDYVPVGKTLDNVAVYVVDEALNPVPHGCAGEICIAGAGVGRGYLGRREETSKVFVTDPFVTRGDVSRGCTTMYRTGDSGIMRPDGRLVVLGRLWSESQVKLRGIRVELGDIASNILKTAAGKLSEAVVTVRGDAEVPVLVAFCVFARGAKNSDTDNYLTSLVERLPLPEYMRPAIIIPLERLPINSNGKLDRPALNQISMPYKSSHNSHESLSSLELDLRVLWKGALPKDIQDFLGIEASSDFFRLGGNSLILVSLRNRIRQQWGIPISLLQLFEASNLRSMASLIQDTIDTQNNTSDCDFWDKETHFDTNLELVHQNKPPASTRSKNKSVLLTGAASHLGSSILSLLLEDSSVARVNCVAISSDDAAKLPQNERLVVYNGGLGAVHLGLSEEDQRYLEKETDVILHAGAEGSCLNNYESIRIQNVESTKFLARLALRRLTPLHYISSSRVVLFTGQNSWPESSVSNFYPSAQQDTEGFTCTKWSSERFLENCALLTGLPICIHRTGYLMSEKADELDAVNMMHKYAVRLGVVPSLASCSGFLDMCEVHSAAAAVVCRALGDVDDLGGRVRFSHHTEDNAVPVEDFQLYMESRFGRSFENLPMSQWAARAELEGMSPVLAAYLEAVSNRTEKARYPRLLKGNGIE
ncbi:hypothetical protein QQS21_006228 [Conoideocrella luteorostrata]|uniref:Polyketide synthase n=1 Tax=Conoideocrella luteorostrata TaxID=1105319 RepID=A0AAJ0FTN8_9HYPO|nr:hypothetical protein QQS21_006228 [Conoideocrella luteorostrata]